MIDHVLSRFNPRPDIDLTDVEMTPWQLVARGARVAVTPRRWLLPARLANGLVVKGYNRPGYGGRGVYMFHDHVESELRLVEALLDDGDWAVDVGSCVGTYALTAAKRVGPSGAAIAVDPNPAAMAVLAANAERNGLRDLVMVCAAASDIAGFESFDDAHKRPDARGLQPECSGADTATRVQTLTVDDVIAGLGPVTRLRVMKVDAEGAEDRVLRGSQASIMEWGPVVVVEQAVRIVAPLPGYGTWSAVNSRNHVWIHESDTDAAATASRLGFLLL